MRGLLAGLLCLVVVAPVRAQTEADSESESESETESETEAETESETETETESESESESETESEGGADSGSDSLGLFDDATLGEIMGEEGVAIPAVEVRAARVAEPAEQDTGAVVHRLDAETLQRIPYDNPEAVLQRVPGAYSRSEDGFGLRPNIGMRGVSANRSARVTLMEDGVLFGPAPYAAPAAYYFPLMSRMDGVDVSLGPAALPYGPMLVGGAIDFRNRAMPRAARGTVDLLYGTNNTARLHLDYGMGNEWGAFMIDADYLHSDGFKHFQSQLGDDDQPSGFPHTGFDRGELVLRGELHGALGDDVYHRLELRLGAGAEASNETYLGLTDADFRADPYLRYDSSRFDRMQWWRTQAQARHTLEVGDDFTLRTAAYRHDFERSWNKVNAMGGLFEDGASQTRFDLFETMTTPTGINAVRLALLRGDEDSEGLSTSNDYVLIGNAARRFQVTGLQSEGTARFETGPLDHRIRLGARLHSDVVERVHDEEEYAVLDRQLVSARSRRYITRDTRAEALALSAFASYALTIVEETVHRDGRPRRRPVLTLTPGVRAELVWTSFRTPTASSRAFRYAVLPGASARWQVIEELGVFAGVMRGFSPVAPGQAQSVRPEDAILYEAGAQLTHRESRTDAQLTGFVNDYSTFLQQCSFSAGCADRAIDDQDNGGAPLVLGLDARVSMRPEIGDATIPVSLAYTFTFSELRAPIVGSSNPLYVGGEAGDRLPYLPMHQVRGQLGFELDPFGINVAGSFVDGAFERAASDDDPTVPRTDAAFMLDATAYIQLFGRVRFYVRGENLTFTRAIAQRRPFGARPTRPLQVLFGARVDVRE